VPAGETKNPERNIPLATMGSLLFAAILFVVVQAVMEQSYPLIAVDSLTPLVDAARYLGPTIGVIVFVGSIVSIGGFTAGSALGAPRYAQAIAHAGQLPSALSRIHARFQTPHIAIATTTLLAAILGMFFNYRELVGFSNVTVVFQYALSCVAVIVLRRKAKRAPEIAPQKPRPKRFRVPGGPVIPVMGAVGSVALLVGSSWSEVGIAVGAIAIGYPLAMGARKLTG
jgi:APA family basic amino acid/polyamine antiporter